MTDKLYSSNDETYNAESIKIKTCNDRKRKGQVTVNTQGNVEDCGVENHIEAFNKQKEAKSKQCGCVLMSGIRKRC